jgi:hypothetical protein
MFTLKKKVVVEWIAEHCCCCYMISSYVDDERKYDDDESCLCAGVQYQDRKSGKKSKHRFDEKGKII